MKSAIRTALDSRVAEAIVAAAFFWVLYGAGWFSSDLGFGVLLLAAVAWGDSILFE